MKKHTIITDLGFGDAGKGTITDWLCRTEESPLVVRYNGGSQAGHNVVTPEGQHHTFAQFGAGTFVPGVNTFLSEYTILNPANMIPEEEHLRTQGVDDAFDRLFVAANALVITPAHIAGNKERERRRGADRHGSTGQGIGEAVSSAMRFPNRAVRIKDLQDPAVLETKLKFWKEIYEAEFGPLGDWPEAMGILLEMGETLNIVDDDWLEGQFGTHSVIFEGAQGVLLDQDYGFHPHTTWSKTTNENAKHLLKGRQANSLGLVRSYMTRHGAGPLAHELPPELGRVLYPEPHNDTGEFQGEFRVGHLDVGAINYSARICREIGREIDSLVVTHCDRITENTGIAVPDDPDHNQHKWFNTYAETVKEEQPMAWGDCKVGNHAELDPVETILDHITQHTGLSISVESYGPTHLDKKVKVCSAQ
jgi:adenylosuccinate synthase